MKDLTLPGTRIGFIGTGVMGRSMAGHLMAAGHVPHLHTRSPSSARDLVERGAIWHDRVADLAALCDVVFVMVGFPADVEQIHLGDGGLIANAKPGAVLVDMTTSCPRLAQRLALLGAERGVHVLDAPVSGGDKGAREGTLSIMVGGEAAVFGAVRPLLEHMGTHIVHQGPAGSGQHCKMCNQITIASTMVGLCEALAYARGAGLDPARVLESISSGAAGSWALSHLAPRILAGDFAPGFFVKHFIKDMKIAAGSAESLAMDLPGLGLALSLYERLAEQGHAESGTQALFKMYRPDD